MLTKLRRWSQGSNFGRARLVFFAVLTVAAMSYGLLRVHSAHERRVKFAEADRQEREAAVASRAAIQVEIEVARSRVEAINREVAALSRPIPAKVDVLKELDTEGHFDHLFINRQTDKPYGTIMKVWSRLRKAAGVPHLRIHDLRHQFASFLVNSGRSLYEVQQILGHSDPSVTQRYAHLTSKSLQAAANTASIAISEAMSVKEAIAEKEVANVID